jgi:hypothetical protein
MVIGTTSKLRGTLPPCCANACGAARNMLATSTHVLMTVRREISGNRGALMVENSFKKRSSGMIENA